MSRHITYITGSAIAIFLIVGTLIAWRPYEYWFSARVQRASEQNTTATTSSRWLTYRDANYHFSIDYPSDLIVVPDRTGVSFHEPGGGPWVTSVAVEPTVLPNPEAWIAEKNKEIGDADQTVVIEESIIIAGYRGIIVHDKVEGVDRHFPKTILFIKDGYIFDITDRSENYEHTWESFRFEE